jgi:hypothetical protein
MKVEDVDGRWQQRRLRQSEAIASEASVARPARAAATVW